MREHGENLSIAREIDFSIIFPSEELAIGFAIQQLRNKQKVSLSAFSVQDKFPWQVQVHPFFTPTHEVISSFEALLAKGATSVQGVNHGWGAMQQVLVR